MIDRNNVVFGLLALLAIVSAIGFALMTVRFGQDPCLSGAEGGSCPRLAVVDGTRYSVSVARGIVLTDAHVTAYKPIVQTNSPSAFAETMTYEIAGIPPDAVLAARAAHLMDGDDSQFRLLWGPERDTAFPDLCAYFNAAEQSILDGCGRATQT